MSGKTRKTVCIFSHYYDSPSVPLYVLVYLKELKNYFSEILLVTNTRPLNNEKAIEDEGIQLMKVKNEGYDFGMFYKGFQTIDHKKYEQVACVNDSNVIFGSLKFLFEWGKRRQVGFWGLVDSIQKPDYSEHADSYHLQSHFIVFNKEAVDLLPEFFARLDIDELFAETNTSLLKKKIINSWEIGVTQFLLGKNILCSAYVESKAYSHRYRNGKPVNVPTKLYTKTIADGVPMLKKRVICSTDLRHILKYKGNWKRLLRLHGDKDFKTDDLIAELGQIRKQHIKNKFKKIFTRN